LTSTEPVSQEDLSRLSDRINQMLRGLSRHEIEAGAPTLPPLAGEVVSRVVNLMGQVDRQASAAIHREGLANILSAPEFADSDRVQNVIRMLEEGALLEAILAEVGLGQHGVQVIIGGGDRWSEINDYSLVLARYGVPEEALGVLGVFGPIRLPYERAVSTVRYVARLMSSLVGELYGY
jgi:heat-inducible transcriptional repressor